MKKKKKKKKQRKLKELEKKIIIRSEKCNSMHKGVNLVLARTNIVRLNLFNQMLALFCIKFVYILAIRYPIFRWDLCKSCVWESMKKT